MAFLGDIATTKDIGQIEDYARNRSDEIIEYLLEEGFIKEKDYKKQQDWLNEK